MSVFLGREEELAQASLVLWGQRIVYCDLVIAVGRDTAPG